MNRNESIETTTEVGRDTQCAPSGKVGRDTPCAPSPVTEQTDASPADAARAERRALPHRRRFLKVAGAALLAGAALPKSAQAFINPIGQLERSSYSLGLVGNGAVAFQVYLITGADGTGFGTLSDVRHPAMNSYLDIQRSGHKGNQVRFEGVVDSSNTTALVGLAFTVDARVQNELTDLSLTLAQDTFTGKGLHLGWIDPETIPIR